MKLSELYPYWGDAHQDLLDAVGLLTEARLDVKPSDNARTIRQMVLHLLDEERFWIAHLVAGYRYEMARASQYPDARALVEALEAQRTITARILEPFSREGLRAVRTVPADPILNRPETNAPVSWLVWHLVELELFAAGQIALRVEDDKASPRKRDE